MNELAQETIQQEAAKRIDAAHDARSDRLVELNEEAKARYAASRDQSFAEDVAGLIERYEVAVNQLGVTRVAEDGSPDASGSGGDEATGN